MDITDNILIIINTAYLADQSEPEENRYVFTYTVKIHNKETLPIQLLSRNWLIADANNKLEEVIGEGVVGETPMIAPEESFEYTSGAILETEIGTMEGFYNFRYPNNEIKKARIPRFTLSIPRTIH